MSSVKTKSAGTRAGLTVKSARIRANAPAGQKLATPRLLAEHKRYPELDALFGDPAAKENARPVQRQVVDFTEALDRLGITIGTLRERVTPVLMPEEILAGVSTDDVSKLVKRSPMSEYLVEMAERVTIHQNSLMRVLQRVELTYPQSTDSPTYLETWQKSMVSEIDVLPLAENRTLNDCATAITVRLNNVARYADALANNLGYVLEPGIDRSLTESESLLEPDPSGQPISPLFRDLFNATQLVMNIDGTLSGIIDRLTI